ncbi:MAG: hypothetical protein HYS04_04255 [Acidobacteria bacterium]|nr:hypothetical protein [Acidobacteriota bacterium]
MDSTLLARAFLCAAALLAAAGVLPAAADPEMLRYVSPNAKFVGGIQVDRTVASPFGQFVLSRVASGDAGLSKFIAATGFDPRRDLREIVVSSEGPGDRNHGLIVARGTFDANRILAQAEAHGATAAPHAGITLITSGKDAKSAWFAFPDGSTFLAGDEASVKGALDRRNTAMPLPARLAAKISEISSGYDLWFVTNAPVSHLAGRLANQQAAGTVPPNALDAIEQAILGVRFGADIRIAGEAVTRSEKDATALVDVVKFLAGMAQLNRDKPGGASMGPLLDTLDLKSEGISMRFSLTVPQAELEKLIKPKPARKVAD